MNRNTITLAVVAVAAVAGIALWYAIRLGW